MRSLSYLLRSSLIVMLLGEIRKIAIAKGNLTLEECLAMERTNSARRLGKAITVAENSPAYLHCRAEMERDDALVAWTRLSDDALLTAGGRSFTSDPRFQISPKRETSRTRDWVLIVRRIRPTDEGCYLCEINTEPLSTLIPAFLQVVSAKQGAEQRSSKPQFNQHQRKRNLNLVSRIVDGSALLNCTVEPEYLVDERSGESRFRRVDVIWTRNGDPLDLLDARKYYADVKVADNGALVHTLWIANMSTSDDGLYACEGSDSTRSSQLVHADQVATDNAAGKLAIAFRLEPLLFLILACIAMGRIIEIPS